MTHPTLRAEIEKVVWKLRPEIDAYFRGKLLDEIMPLIEKDPVKEINDGLDRHFGVEKEWQEIFEDKTNEENYEPRSSGHDNKPVYDDSLLEPYLDGDNESMLSKEKVKSFIQDLLSSERSKIREEVEKLKIEEQAYQWGASLTRSQIFNNAIDEVLVLLSPKSNKK